MRFLKHKISIFINLSLHAKKVMNFVISYFVNDMLAMRSGQ